MRYEEERGAENASELWECALNYRILRNIECKQEADALSRLFECDLFACSARGEMRRRQGV